MLEKLITLFNIFVPFLGVNANRFLRETGNLRSSLCPEGAFCCTFVWSRKGGRIRDTELNYNNEINKVKSYVVGVCNHGNATS